MYTALDEAVTLKLAQRHCEHASRNSGDRVEELARDRPLIVAVDDIPGGVQQTLEMSFECEGASKPSCVAEVIYRSYE